MQERCSAVKCFENFAYCRLGTSAWRTMLYFRGIVPTAGPALYLGEELTREHCCIDPTIVDTPFSGREIKKKLHESSLL